MTLPSICSKEIKNNNTKQTSMTYATARLVIRQKRATYSERFHFFLKSYGTMNPFFH